MDNLQWIKELVHSELAMQENGQTSRDLEFTTPESLHDDTLAFLSDLKSRFVAACSAFNQIKGSSHGRIKIYGIAKTDADFMLFRNGFKLIFSLNAPGKVVASFNHVTVKTLPGQDPAPMKKIDEDLFVAQWKAFGQLFWTHQEQEIDREYLIRHYLSRFIRLSASLPHK